MTRPHGKHDPHANTVANAGVISVLHVEDDPVHSGLVTRLLTVTEHQFRSTNVTTLADALTAIGRETFDVCLLDLGLPDSVGLATLRRILALHVPMPVVVLTGEGDPWLALAAIKMGAQDFLIKDHLDIRGLSRTLVFACARHRGESAVQGNGHGLEPGGVIDCLPLPVAVVDAELHLLFANRAWLSETGQAGDTVSGAPLSWLQHLADDSPVDFERMHSRPRRMRLRRAGLRAMPGCEVICLHAGL